MLSYTSYVLLLLTLEYDNDPDNPDVPVRSAQDSAIFAHLRRNPAARPEVPSRRSDYLGTSEFGSLSGRDSALDNRRSRISKGSSIALRNPFPADTTSDGQENEEEEEKQALEPVRTWTRRRYLAGVLGVERVITRHIAPLPEGGGELTRRGTP